MRTQIGRTKQSRNEVSEETTSAHIATSALATKEIESSTRPISGAQIKAILHGGKQQDRVVVEEYIAQTGDNLDVERTFLLLECSRYFDNVGDAIRSSQVAQIGLNAALELSDLDLLRKAHNINAAAFARISRFEQSSFHLEKALEIARILNNELGEFAILCNMVQMLHAMGLFQEALVLSKQLMTYPEGTKELDYLHLQNAINGLQLARHFDDERLASKFNDIAISKLSTAGHIEAYWRAYVETQHALCLLREGKVDEAHAIILSAVRSTEEKQNFRTDVILSCALARLRLSVNDISGIKDSQLALLALLERSHDFPLHREDLLKTLVELYRSDKTTKGRETGLKLVRDLKCHIINAKHHQFFDRIRSCAANRHEQKIVGLHYDIPSLIKVMSNVVRLEGTSKRSVSDNEQVHQLQYSFSVAGRRRLEQRLRTKDFDVAEDWAIASDYCIEETGLHCFRVGELSGLIAMQLGLPRERSVLIEMACRLHDIGKIVGAREDSYFTKAQPMDDYSLICQHTLAGSQLLSVSTDPVFQIAASVAAHHHEFWNGCGYPHSLCGNEIPLEARICHVADSYVDLVLPTRGSAGWSRRDAVRQIITMQGVQFDPVVVKALVELSECGNVGNLEIRDTNCGVRNKRNYYIDTGRT